MEEVSDKSEKSAVRVLVVEDNPTHQTVARLMLEKLGCSPDLARNGAEAVEAVRKNAYDLVLMDLQMPVMDGLTAATMIRRNESGGRHVTIVAVTTGGFPWDKERCIDAGMDGFLTKPVAIEDLAAILERWNPRAPHLAGREDAPRPAQESGGDDGILDYGRLEQLQTLARRSDAGIFTRLLMSFVEEVPLRLGRLRDAARNHEAKALFEIAHSLKGISGNLGANRMTELCQELQVMGHEGAMDDAPFLVGQVEEEFLHVKRALEKRYLQGETAA